MISSFASMDGPIIQDPLSDVRVSVRASLRLEGRVAGHNFRIKWLHNSAHINEAEGIRVSSTMKIFFFDVC